MKTLVALTTILIVALAALRFLLACDPFMIKVFGVVMLLFGAILVFALGSQIEDMSGGAMEVGGALIITGAITILFI
jgi:hypothetical protein